MKNFQETTEYKCYEFTTECKRLTTALNRMCKEFPEISVDIKELKDTYEWYGGDFNECDDQTTHGNKQHPTYRFIVEFDGEHCYICMYYFKNVSDNDTTSDTNDTTSDTKDTESDTNNDTKDTESDTNNDTDNTNNILESIGNKQLIKTYVDGINNGLQNDSYKQARECFENVVQILPDGYEICFTTKYNEPIYNHSYKIIRDKTGLMFTIHKYSEVYDKFKPLPPETEITDIIRFIYFRTFDSICRVFKRDTNGKIQVGGDK